MISPVSLYSARATQAQTAALGASPTTDQPRTSSGLRVPSVPPSALRKPVIVELVTDPSGWVVRVGGNTSLRTPEGVGIGSDVEQIVHAYPDFDHPFNGKEIIARVPGNPKAEYLFVLDGTGTADKVWLTTEADLDCPG
jgi:hypothetical protein